MKLKGYEVTCGTTHFFFSANEEDLMFAFLGTAIKKIEKNGRGEMDRVSAMKVVDRDEAEFDDEE